MTNIKRKNTCATEGSQPKQMCIKFDHKSEVHYENELSRHGDADECTEHKRCYPNKFVSFMYKLHLSILCLLRKSQCDHKYPSLSISFDDEEIDKFKDIVIRHQEKSVHIRIVDDHFLDYDITYSKIFLEHQTFSLDVLFNSFVKYFIYKPFKFMKSVEYLVIYTNLKLDIGKNCELNHEQRKKFHPFRFEKIPLEELGVLQNLSVVGNYSTNIDCYRFSQDKITEQEFAKRLNLSCTMQKAIEERKLSSTFVDRVREKFFNKLVFMVNQPHRERLKTVINLEVGKTKLNFLELQEKVLSSILRRPSIMYEFKLLISVLHDLFLENSICLNYENNDAFSYISIKYRNKTTFVKVFVENKRINYNQLFPPAYREWKSNLTLNKQLLHFIEELKRKSNIKFFIIYTNAHLDLANNNILKGSQMKDPIHFHSIDISKRRFKILRQLNGIDKKNLYQISNQNESILELLNGSKENLETFTCQQMIEMKKAFLHKLIFATSQPSERGIQCMIENKIRPPGQELLHSYEVLQEMTVRWIESYKFGSISRSIAEKILYEIKNNISTYQKLKRKDIAAEIKFTSSVTGRVGSFIFNNFLQYIVAGRGKKYLEDFRKSGLELNSVSGILHRAGAQAVVTLENLHKLWYEDDGRESQYLQTLRKNRLKLSTVSSFLNEAGPCAPDAFKDLFFVWFDEHGNKTRYLSTLEAVKVSLINLSSMLHGGGRDAAIGFKNLFDLLFDEGGNKTKYLKLLEEKGVDLVNFSTILHCAGRKAAEAFKDLYDVLFDSNGEKTFYLKVLEANGIELESFCPLLNGSGAHAGSRFESVFHLFFDKEGNKTHYLINMERENISLLQLNSVLSGARSHVMSAFKELYNVWFDEYGGKTQYLKVLKENDIDLHTMTTILFGSGSRAAQAFKNLYHLLFDENGQKSVYLRTLLKNGISLTTIGYMLSGTKTHASHAYKMMHHILFDDQGNKSERFQLLEREGISLSSISVLLKTAKSNIESAFDDLYSLWFDETAAKTRYLRMIEENSLKMSRVSAALHASGCDAAKAYKSLFDCWFDETGAKTRHLKIFEQNGLDLSKILTLLYKAGKNCSQIFMDIYNLWFDEEGDKNAEVEFFENEGISLLKLKTLFRGLGSQFAMHFNNFFYFWFHKDGSMTQTYNTFKKNHIDLKHLLTIFKTLKANALEAIRELYLIWFTPEGEKTQLSLSLETNGVELFQMIDVIRKTNDEAPKILIDLLHLWFDSSGSKTEHLIELERKGMSLSDVVKILAGAGKHAVDRFMDL